MAATAHYSSATNNPFWYNELVDEKAPKGDLLAFSPDTLWGGPLTKYNEPKLDSQGNLYKADYVTRHPEILDPFRVHAPMPAPTMPEYAKSTYSITNNNITPNKDSLFDPFSPPAQHATSSIPSKPKEVVITKVEEPKPEYDYGYEVEPEPVSLGKSRSKSATKKQAYDNTFHPQREDLPIRYPVAKSNKSKKNVLLYQEGYPVILEDIVDREDYINVVKGINAAIIGALKQKRYSNGVSGILTVTGVILVVPLIPAMMLEDKKAKKVRKAKQMYLDSINPQFERRGLKWTLYSEAPMVGMVPRLHLEITNLKLLTPDMRALFLCMKSNSSFTI